MENRNLQDDIQEIDQVISVLEEQEKKEDACLNEFSNLTRELTEQETRRESTAESRCTAFSAEILELLRLRSALMTRGRAMVRDATTEKAIQKLKTALKVEEAARGGLDLLATLSPHERRRAKVAATRCATYVDRLLQYRKAQTSAQGRLVPAVPKQSGSSSAPTWSSYDEVKTALISPIRVDSPTRKGGKALLRPALASFSLDGPVFLKPVLGDDALSAMRSAEMSNKSLLEEGAFYELVGTIIPAWVVLLGKRSGLPDGTSAGIMYRSTADVPSFQPVQWPWACLPELLTRSTALHAGFNAEVKSVSGKTWNELLTYVAMSIVDSLFRCSSDVRFYAKPPVGFGVVSFPHCGYVVAVEWIGKLIATPYSQPFFIGSEQHKAAVAKLPDICFKKFINVEVKEIKWHPLSSRKVLWTKFPTVLRAEDGDQLVNQFLKLVPCSSYDHLQSPAGFLRRLYKTYERYGAALTEGSVGGAGGAVPQALLGARLWFGIFAVVVTMEFVDGKEATVKQLEASTPDDEKGARAIASAVVWLARHGLIYYDLREPNILVDSGGCWRLIDYDDMVMVEPGSVNTVAEMKTVLEKEQHLYHLDGVVAAFTRFPKLLGFVDDAFQSD